MKVSQASRAIAKVLLASSLLASGSALAQPGLIGAPVRSGGMAPTYADSQTVRVDLSDTAAPVRTLSLPRGKSAVIDLPTDAQDVFVSDQKVADVVMSTRRHINVLGIGSGQTDATFVDASGRQILRLNIRVDQDISALSETLGRILPGSSIRVDSVNDSLILSGEVSSAGAADKAVRLAQAFVSKPDQVINMLGVAQSEQVMLKVRVVEVNRSVIKQLGFNLSALVGQVGSAQYLLGQAATFGVNGSLLGGLTGGYQLDTTQKPELQVPCATGISGTCYQVIHPGTNTYVDSSGVTHTIANPNTATAQTTVGSSGLNKATSTIAAFERVGLVRTLAEPNLTAISGESGKFLVGGEFPVPAGISSSGQISVDYKSYGVGLGYTPVVLSSGRISLKISAEVSELTSSGGITISSGGASETIPGLSVRRVETTVELPSGGAMMLAGLIQSQTKETLDSLPGLMQVPVIGSLLRSRDFQNNETELAIIVEPVLVKAVRPDQLQTPADGLQIASDVETNLLGHLNTGFGKKPQTAAVAPYQGPYGYVVD